MSYPVYMYTGLVYYVLFQWTLPAQLGQLKTGQGEKGLLQILSVVP